MYLCGRNKKNKMITGNNLSLVQVIYVLVVVPGT